MSSLAAARADNFYYPPDWDPNSGTKVTSQVKGAKTGSLGQRANNTSDGILIIRFEMPFNVWCDGCNHLIGKGVRFNAEKRQAGNYFSTKIWSFTMLAPCCQQKIEVRTDPKTCEYLIIQGARRKVEDYDAEESGTAVLPSAEEREAINSNPFARLENGQIDKAKAMGERERIAMLRADNEDKHYDDYHANKALRRRLRTVRKEAKALEQHRDALGVSQSVKLLPFNQEDALMASAVRSNQQEARFSKNLLKSRHTVKHQSIFSIAKAGTNYRKPTSTDLLSSGHRPRAASGVRLPSSASGAVQKKRTSVANRLQGLAKRQRTEVARPRAT